MLDTLPPISHACDVSVIIPCKNERDNLAFLIDEVGNALTDLSFELIIVDDGSDDDTDTLLRDYARTRPWLRHLRHATSCGQSNAVRTGLLHARGEFIATLDGDGQNDPAFFPQMVAALREKGPDYALAAGQRMKRTDGFVKKHGSRLANAIRQKLLKDNTRDSGCGLKVIRRQVFLNLPFFEAWHRFLPALVVREGLKIVHIDVIDRGRSHGNSKYGIFDRLWVGIIDMLGVYWLRKRRQKIPTITEIDLGNSN
ncbi:Glycosyltransferase involved in cell wall bisynthesis [Cohaesibacter sp. ES.047]|uniref:glycosyltransferase family 2 protein n=1 Tax=Cohaesibacter sp. ES.047 TaxID=1798205 RepID=UPI000BB97838|nr:glycosyltransferase family 2 protein [Cohaesibacter sp. ES.047]SNY93481.1 Glycosyltransferase involved in cell wall bisynthesis [Cohaesibacter sp. ES.047]